MGFFDDWDTQPEEVEVGPTVGQELAEESVLDREDPYVEDRGFFGDTMSSLGRGGLSLLSLGSHAYETISGQESSLDEWAKGAREDVDFFKPDAEEYLGEPGVIKRGWQTAMESLVPSVGGALPTAIAGAAYGSMFGPAGTAIGGAVGGLVGTAALFGYGTYGEAKEEALSQGATEEDAHAYAKNQAFIEGGIETAATGVEFATAGLGKFFIRPVTATLKSMMKMGPKEIAKTYAKTMGVEVSTEMMQAGLGAENAQAYGIQTEDTLTAIGESIIPAIFMSGIFVTGAQGYNARQKAQLKAALSQKNPTAIDIISQNLEKQDPELARDWKTYAADVAADDSKNFDINQDLTGMWWESKQKEKYKMEEFKENPQGIMSMDSEALESALNDYIYRPNPFPLDLEEIRTERTEEAQRDTTAYLKKRETGRTETAVREDLVATAGLAETGQLPLVLNEAEQAKVNEAKKLPAEQEAIVVQEIQEIARTRVEKNLEMDQRVASTAEGKVPESERSKLIITDVMNKLMDRKIAETPGGAVPGGPIRGVPQIEGFTESEVRLHDQKVLETIKKNNPKKSDVQLNKEMDKLMEGEAPKEGEVSLVDIQEANISSLKDHRDTITNIPQRIKISKQIATAEKDLATLRDEVTIADTQVPIEGEVPSEKPTVTPTAKEETKRVQVSPTVKRRVGKRPVPKKVVEIEETPSEVQQEIATGVEGTGVTARTVPTTESAEEIAIRREEPPIEKPIVEARSLKEATPTLKAFVEEESPVKLKKIMNKILKVRRDSKRGATGKANVYKELVEEVRQEARDLGVEEQLDSALNPKSDFYREATYADLTKDELLAKASGKKVRGKVKLTKSQQKAFDKEMKDLSAKAKKSGVLGTVTKKALSFEEDVQAELEANQELQAAKSTAADEIVAITNENVFTTLRDLTDSFFLNQMIDFVETTSKANKYTDWNFEIQRTDAVVSNGYYDPETGVTSVDIAQGKIENSEQSADRFVYDHISTILHEMNHAMTVHGFETNTKASAELEELLVDMASKLPSHLKDLHGQYYVPGDAWKGSANFTEDREILKADPRYSQEELQLVYGLLDVMEFSSSPFTSTDMVRYLKNTKVSGTHGVMNGLQKFIQMVSKVLGLDRLFGPKEVSAYEALMGKTLQIAKIQSELGSKQEMLQAYNDNLTKELLGVNVNEFLYEDLTTLEDPIVFDESLSISDLDILYGLKYSLDLSDSGVKATKRKGKFYKHQWDSVAKKWGEGIEIPQMEYSSIKEANRIARNKKDEEFFRSRKATEGVKDKALELVESIRKGFREIAEPTHQTVQKILPKLAELMNRMELSIMEHTAKYTKRMNPFLKGLKKLKKTDKYAYKQLGLALLNIDYDRKTADELLAKHNLTEHYKDIEWVLKDIHQKNEDVGMNLYKQKQSYFPRVVEDVDGLMAYLQGNPEDRGVFSAILNEENLTDKEREDMVANVLSTGRTTSGALRIPGSVRERSIQRVSSKMSEFYRDPLDTLQSHIHESLEAIGTRRFIGKTARKATANKLFTISGAIDKETSKKKPDIEKLADLKRQWDDLAKTYDGFSEISEDSVAGLILKEGKDLSEDQQRTLNVAIRSRLNQKGMHGAIAKVRDIGLITALGSPLNTITQLGDFVWSVYKNGPINTIRAIIDRKELKASDFSLDSPLKEFQEGGLGGWVDKTLTYTGFKGLDQFAKEVSMQASLNKGRSMSSKEFVEKYSKLLGGDTNAMTTHTDLMGGEITDNVRFFVFSDISQFQPISLSQMPAKYLTAGNGRIFYSLKSYSIKALSNIRRESFDKMMVPGTRAEGARNLVMLGSLLVFANAGIDELKDWLLGKDEAFSDNVYDNFLKLGFMSRYTVDTGLREGFAKSWLTSLLTPPGISVADPLLQDTMSWLDFDKDNTFKSLQGVPLIGKLAYSRTKGGKERTLTANKKGIYKRIREDVRGGGGDFNKIRKDINKYNRTARSQGLDLITNKQIRRVKSAERKKMRGEK